MYAMGQQASIGSSGLAGCMSEAYGDRVLAMSLSPWRLSTELPEVEMRQ